MIKIVESTWAARLGHLVRGLSRRRPTAPRLVLELGGRRLEIRGPREFEFACAGRITVPAARYGELMRLPPVELEREASGIRKVERQLLEVLEPGTGDPTGAGTHLRDLGLKLFSKDHRWREIIEALNALGPAYDVYRRIAVVKYSQYLAARQEIIAVIYAAKSHREIEQAEAAEVEQAARGIGTRETVVFDLMQIQDSHRFVNPFERLPRGETVEVRVPRGEGVEILLSKHSFRLRAGDGLTLVDDAGHVYPLLPGRNSVGRHINNDVAIDAAYRSVSRRHLIAEPHGADTVLITDLSSHGTFVPPEYVHHTVH